MNNRGFYVGVIAGIRMNDVSWIMPYEGAIHDGLRSGSKKADDLGIEGLIKHKLHAITFLKTGDMLNLLAPEGLRKVIINLQDADSAEEYLRKVEERHSQIIPPTPEEAKEIGKGFLETYERICGVLNNW